MGKENTHRASGKILSVTVFTFSLLLLFLLLQGSDASENCTTGQCHSALLQRKNIHPVTQTCVTCHQTALSPHPQKDKKTFTLKQEMSALCTSCHSGIGRKKYTHTPVKGGMCTSCHDPHGSEEKKLLLHPPGSLCIQCHSDKGKYRYVHGPTATGDCIVCHLSHDSDNKALLLQQGSGLCLVCHTDMEKEVKKKYIHSAMKSGCTSCHNPHGSDASKKMLAADGENLCYQCHSAIGDKVKKSKVVHAPIKSEQGCSSCHSPHASDGEKLLQKSGKDACLSCHSSLIKKNHTLLHGPINSGSCTPCHDPHGAPEPKLLAKGFSSEFYLPYSDNDYKLCFSCHNRDLLQYPDTSHATGFRDGDRNLHYLHVNRKDKGRNCKACHTMHGGVLPKLIADKVLFGKWELPMRFVKTETGGSCSPGCHKNYHYDRKTPGKAPEPVKSKEKGAKGK